MYYVYKCLWRLNLTFYWDSLNAVVRAESYPEIFFKLWETITCHLLKPNSKFKKFHRQKISSIFKGFDREIINFQE